MSEKIRVLIVEDDVIKRSEFKSVICMHTKFELCGETGGEAEAISMLKNKKTDVIILDLELEEGTGITLAQKMRKLPICQPFVVVTTNNCSKSILQYLRSELKIDFIFNKLNTSYCPAQVLNFIENVYKYHSYSNPKIVSEKELLKDRISQELLNIGFSAHHDGKKYLIAALLIISENQETSLKVSKHLYPAIAKQYNTSSSNVEKAIRLAIESVWNHANLINLYKYYPYEIENKNGRPSNGEFISKMSIKLFGKS